MTAYQATGNVPKKRGLIRFKAAVLLAVVVLGALLPGCQSPASAPDNLQQAYEKAFAGAAWAAHVQEGFLIEEWKDEKDGLTTFYRRYLAVGAARSMTGEESVTGGLYISVPFATQKDGEEKVWLMGVPDIEAMAMNREHSANATALWAGQMQTHSQRYSFAKLFFLMPLEGHNEYTLYTDVSVMDIQRSVNVNEAKETDYLLCVPLYGEKIGALAPVWWTQLEQWIHLDFAYKSYQPEVFSPPIKTVTPEAWTMRQPNIAIGRFTGFVGEEDTNASRYLLYTFEVERVLGGNITKQTIIVRQHFSTALYMQYDVISLFYKHPQLGQRVVLGLRDDYLGHSQADYEFAEVGVVTSLWNINQDGWAVARQWPLPNQGTKRSVDTYLIQPIAIELSQMEAWLAQTPS